MSCHGLCERHKAQRRKAANSLVSTFYGHPDHKRCTTCIAYIKWSGDYCPCCGCKLRSKPRYRNCNDPMHANNAFELQEEITFSREIRIPIPPEEELPLVVSVTSVYGRNRKLGRKQ